MISITLNFETTAQALEALGRLQGTEASLGNVRAAAAAAAAGPTTAKAGAAPEKTASVSKPAAASAAAARQGSTAAAGEAGNGAPGAKPTAASTASSEKPTGDAPTPKAVADAITKAVAAGHRDAVVALLGEYGAKRGADLADGQREGFMLDLGKIGSEA